MKVYLAAAALVIPGTATAEGVGGSAVCERMASQIGMKHVPLSGRDGAVEEWRLDNAKLKDHLFGGTVATSIGMEPADDGTATGDDYRRFASMCERTAKGAECRVEGPARLTVGTKRGAAKVVAVEGERAIVGIRGTTVYCRRA